MNLREERNLRSARLAAIRNKQHEVLVLAEIIASAKPIYPNQIKGLTYPQARRAVYRLRRKGVFIGNKDSANGPWYVPKSDELHLVQDSVNKRYLVALSWLNNSGAMMQDLQSFFNQHPQAKAMVALIDAALMSLQAIYAATMEVPIAKAQETAGTKRT